MSTAPEGTRNRSLPSRGEIKCVLAHHSTGSHSFCSEKALESPARAERSWACVRRPSARRYMAREVDGRSRGRDTRRRDPRDLTDLPQRPRY
eukprot:1079252-Rhodomonas_salina.2